MKSIPQNYVNDKNVNSSIINFFKIYKIASVLKSSNAYKQKGVPVAALFQYLFRLDLYESKYVYEHAYW